MRLYFLEIPRVYFPEHIYSYAEIPDYVAYVCLNVAPFFSKVNRMFPE